MTMLAKISHDNKVGIVLSVFIGIKRIICLLCASFQVHTWSCRRIYYVAEWRWLSSLIENIEVFVCLYILLATGSNYENLKEYLSILLRKSTANLISSSLTSYLYLLYV